MPKLRIRFLGTGNAFNTDGRGSQSLWVERNGAHPFLVDAGPTVLAAMGRYQLDPESLGRLFLTHLHGDHIAGWPFVLLYYIFVSRRSRPFAIFGPDGTRERLEALARACYGELLAAANLAFPLQHREIPVVRGQGIDGGDKMTFDVVPLEHDATSIGYRFHLDGLTIGVTGDTRWCPGLEDLAAGCDLLILECTSVAPMEAPHVSLEELRLGREHLKAKQVVLVHLDDTVARALAEKPIPGVEAASDGLVLEL